MSATQTPGPSSEGFISEQATAEAVASDGGERGRVGQEAAGDIGGKDAFTPRLGSVLQRFGRLVLFVVLVLFGGIMCLGVGVALLECLSSYYDEDGRVGEFLFTAFFEGFLGWGSLWLALRVSPWAKPGRKSWNWVRRVFAAGGVILIAITLMVVISALVWLWMPLGHKSLESPAIDITGTWSLDLKESSPDFGPSEIESGTLEFDAKGHAKRTLRLKQFGNVTEHVTDMDGWKLVGSDKLRFKLGNGRDRYELSISLSEDQLSFTDWETYGVETWRRELTRRKE